MKVAVHDQAYVTKSGDLAPNWRRWHVYSGPNPEGPRGGRQGLIVNGRWVLGPYRTKIEADAAAKEYADKNGYELI